ncbi:eEF1A lysine and N-terminal methyltransferase isoform X1 [Vigna umbellata]|uniref:eEF1A lysine and N-terminal methyltransferase isoform X1 n=1 Tax=Vigna umbellata TaxID=87088 RepID=UPI001F5F6777|nr:eEF1A lysine and N-terminal methyltransferase isoform X1 [Vigna umbellata]XP_047153775.1 eEF1A lysine and N-terminal methyltransferase isoform X1 [Vigna umbellata]XP_047153776.1 eEF1A lysine and N-terminal methyltransferase isoform X1 [Vigna umbellata]
MALDASTFETLTPSRFISFTIPHPSFSNTPLRVAVLDSPVQPNDVPQVGAMLVPEGREIDWIFSTELGHLQLLLSSPEISRLILIGNNFKEGTLPFTPHVYHRPLECSMHQQGFEVWSKPLLLALSPKSLFKRGIPEIPILSYVDNLVSSVVVHQCAGIHVGEMLVEDVEIENGGGVLHHGREFRRRLRFKRMPNLIQTEICIVPVKGGDCLDGVCIGGNVRFVPYLKVLVHPYLGPMVAGLVLNSEYVAQRIQNGFKPKALCLGVGGGALATFLRTQLGFEVMAVDSDREVLRVAREYFGLEESKFIHVVVGDAFESLKKLVEDEGNGKFDVVMVDLDSSDIKNGVSSPPVEFVRKDVLLAAKLVLCEYGILAINVIPPSRYFYDNLVSHIKEVFHELYEIDVGNGENFVLVATASPLVFLARDCVNSFLMRLKSVIPEAYLKSITKI